LNLFQSLQGIETESDEKYGTSAIWCLDRTLKVWKPGLFVSISRPTTARCCSLHRRGVRGCSKQGQRQYKKKSQSGNGCSATVAISEHGVQSAGCIVHFSKNKVKNSCPSPPPFAIKSKMRRGESACFELQTTGGARAGVDYRK